MCERDGKQRGIRESEGGAVGASVRSFPLGDGRVRAAKATYRSTFSASVMPGTGTVLRYSSWYTTSLMYCSTRSLVPSMASRNSFGFRRPPRLRCGRETRHTIATRPISLRERDGRRTRCRAPASFSPESMHDGQSGRGDRRPARHTWSEDRNRNAIARRSSRRRA